METTIAISISTNMADEIETRAASMYLSSDEYCTAIVAKWVESAERLTLKER